MFCFPLNPLCFINVENLPLFVDELASLIPDFSAQSWIIDSHGSLSQLTKNGISIILTKSLDFI